jgi:hypothetical protein
MKQYIIFVNTTSCFSHSQTITSEAIIGAVKVLISFTPLFCPVLNMHCIKTS